MDLDALLDPVRSEYFFERHWERQPIHRRGDVHGRASFRPDLPADLDPSTTLAFLRFLDDEGFLEHLD